MARLADLLKPGGSIVLTALTSYERSPVASLYAATEGAMMSMARCWAAALANRNIRVNVLVPGPINTSLRDDMRAEFRSPVEEDLVVLVPLSRTAIPEEAAEVALLLLAGELAFRTASQYAMHRALTMR